MICLIMAYSFEEIEKIRQEFVQGTEENGVLKNLSIESLAKKYNIPSITLYRKSKEDNWKQQQKDFKEELQNEIDAQKREQMTKEAVDFDSNSLRIAKALQGEIVKLLNISNKKRQENPNESYFSPSSLNSLGMALQTCQRVGRLALGESTENTNVTNKQSTIEEAFQLIDEICDSRRESQSNIH